MSLKLLFDIESNGLLDTITTIHCIVVRDLETGQVFVFNDQGRLHSVQNGLTLLMEADELWGHNICNYDIPAIRKVFPWFYPKATCYDTMIMSRMLYSDILNRDLNKKPDQMPAKLFGRHSLEAWGYRLGEYKSEFGKTTDWADWSQELEDYCVQDTEVNLRLRDHFLPALEKYPSALELEHGVAKMMALQEESGIRFDVKQAQQLESTLRTELEELSDQMLATFPYVDGGEFTPQRNNKTRHYINGATFCKLKEFNPTSRFHIAWAFKNWRNWTPTEFTDTGTPKIDEAVLKTLGTEEALIFARILELQKALGQLSDGNGAWLKSVTKDGFIHHSCQLATNTGRNAHRGPNISQVSSDPRCRALFLPNKGQVWVDADASGLELRMLGHYLSAYDGGSFADVVVNGDIHQQNADRVGVTRTQVKSLTYCFIYGGSDTKLGLTYDQTLAPAKAKKKGKELRKAFLEAIPGLEQLTEAIKVRASSDVLIGLDGRPIRLQGKGHVGLNYLLQSSGSQVCKRWGLILFRHLIDDFQFKYGQDFTLLAFIHDSWGLSVKPDRVDTVKRLLELSIVEAGEFYKLRVPMAAEPKVGSSWKDVH
jgi:DNA polymerase I-like protein with 3'-5' exonuclease and polymerase domains